MKPSKIQHKTNIVTQIHQYMMDLENSPPKKEVQRLIFKSISYLDQDLDLTTSSEVFSLILSCFSHYPDQSIQFFYDILQKVRNKWNYIIAAASILSYLTFEKPDKSLPDYKSFVYDSYNQILHQIQKRSYDECLFIYDQAIPFQFESNFVIDILTLVKFNKKHAFKFYHYISDHSNISQSRLNRLIQKVPKEDLRSILPKSFFYNTEFISNLSVESLINFIPNLPKDGFIQLITEIEKIFMNKDKRIRTVILEKIIEYNIDIKSINQIFKSLSKSDLKPSVWSYLAKFDVILPDYLAEKVTHFPNAAAAVKLMPHPENLPQEIIDRCLLEATDLNVYERLFNLDFISSELFAQKKFWLHIVKVVSNWKEECKSNIITKFSMLIQNCVSSEKFPEIFDSMVFDQFPPNNKVNSFLSSLYQKLEYEYREGYFDKKNMEYMMNKLLEKRTIPLPSFCKLFDFMSIGGYLNKKLSNAMVLYVYEFSYMKEYSEQIESISIQPLNKESMKKIYNFIENESLDDLVKVTNSEALYFIVSALIYTSSSEKPQINGLTKSTILPFFAICFIYLPKCKGSLTSMTVEMSEILFKGFTYFGEINSPILNISIDAIMASFEFFLGPKYFRAVYSYNLLDKLFSIFTNDSYNADKELFLVAVFCLSQRTHFDVGLSDIFDKYGIRLIKYIINKMNGLIGHDKQIKNFELKLNLAVFDLEKVVQTFDEFVSNSTSKEKVFQTVFFIQKYCQNVPEIEISNKRKLTQILSEKMNHKEWENFPLIGQFMKHCNLENDLEPFFKKSIPFSIKSQIFESFEITDINDLIQNILMTSQLENCKEPFHQLFKILMTENSIATDYITVLFEKFGKSQYVETELFLKHYYTEYKKYKESFIEAVLRCFYYHPLAEKFIRKAEYKAVTFPQSKLGLKIIDSLLDRALKTTKKGSFQAFFILKNIAASFPFIFIKNTQKTFQTILTSLNYFSFCYQDKDSKETAHKAKLALTALSFLYSLLFSTSILDTFVPWLFNNFDTFNESQFLSFSLILISLFQTDRVKYVILSLSMKFDLIKSLIKRLKMDINESELVGHYECIIYNLIIQYYTTLNNLSKNKIIYVDEIGKIKNPFTFVFNNNSTIFPYSLTPINIDSLKTNFNQFYKKIDEIETFHINYDFIYSRSEYYEKYKEEELVGEVVSLQNSFSDIDEVPSIPYYRLVNVIRYVSTQPRWIFKWIVHYEKFPLLKEHYLMLCKAIDEIKRIRKEALEEDEEILWNTINVHDYYLKEYKQESLIKILIKELKEPQNDQTFLSLCKLLREIADNDIVMLSVLQLVTLYIKRKRKKDDALEPIKRMLKMLIFISDNESFHSYFMKECGNILIETAMYPTLRNDVTFLTLISNLLTLQITLPSSVIHIIGFMFLSNKTVVIPHALELCSKVGIDNLDTIIPVINNAFDSEISKPNPSYSIITSFIENVPFLSKPKISKMKSFVNLTFKKFKQSGFEDEQLVNLICSLFNILAPEPKEDEFVIPGESKEIDFSLSYSRTGINKKKADEQDMLLNPVPIKLKNQDEFWNLYEKHRMILNKVIEKDEKIVSKMRFLFDFPELLQLKKRASYFLQKMKNLIDDDKSLSVRVDRYSSVFLDSFEQLRYKSPKEWLNKLRVSFSGEAGIDVGGLTREWFTLIINELFDPKLSLFKLTGNNSYQPLPIPDITQEQIEYFNFAGKIIARALIEGICINAHLSRSFCRQILHREVKLIDLEDYDESIYNSLRRILEEDVEPLELDFTIDIIEKGQLKNIKLKKNGDKINVTNKNKKEYVSLYCNYHLRESISKQISSFCEGFNSIIPSNETRLFNPNELDLLICGVPKIDVSDLRQNTSYEYPYDEDHPVINLFFETIAKWRNEDLGKLLLFLTGSSQVPVNGFKDYNDRGKPITIGCGGERERLCVAHTCFNRLELPMYETEYEMNNKLFQSIQESEFGLS